MADIFISYSKPDRDKVVMLATYLESEGWTVWWDKNLSAGELYRDEIMRELVAARAVIVLWTPTSIQSDFVRAETGRAKADGKLIPVKTDDVGHGDIPLPFGEMHTESHSSKELIRAAVVTQLAKPTKQASALWLATRMLRYQVLTWFGIVGGTITVFTGFRGILELAAWVSWIVESLARMEPHGLAMDARSYTNQCAVILGTHSLLCRLWYYCRCFSARHGSCCAP